MSGADTEVISSHAESVAALRSARGRAAESPPMGRARSRRRTETLPYLLILPSIAAFIGLLGYPLFEVIKISFQKLDLGELIQRQTVYVGLENYRAIFSDPFFWTVLVRTALFTVVCVGLTMTLATLTAFLLHRLGKGMRLLVSIGMVMAWAMPPLTATVVWQWLFDTQFGVVNWTLTNLGVGDFTDHSWFGTGLSTFAIIVMIIVWQAIPFVAFTLYAGLISIPQDLYDAVKVDGADAWQSFRHLIFPVLKPLFMITGFLSVIWDFKVFTQVWLVRQGGPGRSTVTLSLYTYQEGIASSHFGTAAAISVVMVVVLLIAMVQYIRVMLRTQEEL